MPKRLTQSDLHSLWWLTLREAASQLGLSEEAVRQKCEDSEIQSATVDGSAQRRVHLDEVKRFAKHRKAA